MKKIIIPMLGLTLSAFSLFGQSANPTPYAESITAEDHKKHLEVLASDAYEGRETGFEGQKKAAEYISAHFKSLGLQGPVKSDTPYYQQFTLDKYVVKGLSLVSKKGVTLQKGKDFFTYGDLPEDPSTYKLVFAGYGLESGEYSDYKGIEVKNNVLAILAGVPKDKEGKPLFSTGTTNMNADFELKIRKAQELGASGVIISMDSEETLKAVLLMFKNREEEASLKLPKSDKSSFFMVFTGPKGISSMLNTTVEKLDKLVQKKTSKKQSPSGSIVTTMNMKLQFEAEEVPTENVLGYLEGTDLKDEVIVISAHYDHVGMHDGKVFNGADDDGSGTVAVMELAEAFAKAKKNGEGPRRSILFVGFTGEEKGLLGSEYYSQNPVFPLNQTITNLNIDMIGRIDDAHKKDSLYVYIIGSNMLSSELHAISEETSKKYVPNLKLDYRYNSKDDPNRFYYRSDHYNFAKHRIPCIFYFNGTHEDYHQATDTIEKITFPILTERAKVVFYTAWELANRDSKPTVDQLSEDNE